MWPWCIGWNGPIPNPENTFILESLQLYKYHNEKIIPKHNLNFFNVFPRNYHKPIFKLIGQLEYASAQGNVYPPYSQLVIPFIPKLICDNITNSGVISLPISVSNLNGINLVHFGSTRSWYLHGVRRVVSTSDHHIPRYFRYGENRE